MRILIISDYYQSQISYAKVTVALELKRQGHQVQVVTSDRYFPFHDYQDTAGKILGSRIQQLGKKTEKGITVYRQPTYAEFFARAFFGGISNRIKAFKPDVVLVFGIASPSAVQVARFRRKHPELIPKLIFADSHLPSELALHNSFLKKMVYTLWRWWFATQVASAGDRFIALQDDTVGVIRTIYGISRQVMVLPNGTDTSMYFFDKSAGQQVREKLDIPAKDFVIIYTGKLVPSKGIEILIKAFKKLTEQYDDVHCLLVGDGPAEYKECCLAVLSATQRHKVHITGMVRPETLYRYYSAADVGVWPLQESLAMVDAAACGLPFIANHTLGARERIKNQNALLYKKGSWQDLHKKIAQLYSDPTLRKKMGQRGKELVIRELQWEKIAKAYINS